MITKKYYKLIRVSYADEGYFCLTNVGNSIGIVKIDNPSGTSGGAQPNYEYSTDGVTWNSYTTRGTEISVDPNANIYWRYAGSGGTLGDSNVFYFDFDCYASGNLMSLYEKTNFASYTGDWNASKLFYGQTHLLRADFNLGAQTTIGYESLSYTFYQCTSLTTAPDFSNITIIGDYSMSYSFYGCTSLTTAPDLSNVTSVGQNGMSSMFQSCTSLTTAPDLSNVTSVGQNGMRSMFQSCTSLTTGPDLRNVTTVGYAGMSAMFLSCNHLTTVYAPTITWDTNNTAGWLMGVSASGTLYADSSIASTIPTNNQSGCPFGWTVATL